MDILGLFTTNYILTAALFLPVLIIFYWYQTKDDNYWKKRGISYNPRMSLLYTFYVIFRKQFYEAELEKYRKFGRVYGDFEFRVPFLTIAEPDFIRDVFVKDFQYFTTTRDFGDYTDPVMSKMIFAMNGEDWKRVRTIVTPAFSSGKMRKMAHIINDCSKELTDTFISNSRNGTLIDCKKTFAAYTMDVIARSAFATKINSHEDPNNPFVVQAYNAFNKNALLKMLGFLFLPLPFWKLAGLRFIDPGSAKFFTSVALQLIEERRKTGKRGNDFLQLMMDAYKEQLESDKKMDGFKAIELDEDENDAYGDKEVNKQVFKAIYSNRSLSQDELFAQCIMFFMVGYETTASTISFVAYNLACHPSIQQKLIEEIDRTVKGNEELTYDIIRDMKYLDCIVSETMRMYPSLIRTQRTAVKDYKANYRGLTIPKGMMVAVPVYAMHQDPEFFAEPEKFIPERFLPENIRHPSYAYLPFGAGPRNCLGNRFALMQIKLCIANALRRIRFKTCAETKIPPKFSNPQGFLSPGRLLLSVEKRKDIP